MASAQMPFAPLMMMLVALLLMGASVVLASPIATPYSQPTFTSTSNLTCPTTVVTYTAPDNGPTSTVYTHTRTITREYDCRGCDSLVVQDLGHIFQDIPLSHTTTITKARPTTKTQPVCSANPGNVHTSSLTVSKTETLPYVTITVAGSKTVDSELPSLSSSLGIVSKTETAGYITITVSSATGDSTLQTLSATKRSEDFEEGNNIARETDEIDGREDDERYPTSNMGPPPVCWNSTTGLFDFSVSGHKITYRSQLDEDKNVELPRHHVTKRDEISSAEDCQETCIISFADHYKLTAINLLACYEECTKPSICGHSNCTAETRTVNVEIQERTIIDGFATCQDYCDYVGSQDPTWSPTDQADCLAICYSSDKRATKLEIEERDVSPSACYDTCISQYSNPGHLEINHCQVTCAALGLGPICVGEECPVAERAVDTEDEIEERRDSLYGHPNPDQEKGCRLEGTALVCPS